MDKRLVSALAFSIGAAVVTLSADTTGPSGADLRKDGEIAWKKTIAAGNYKINKQNMSSPSPVTDGRTVWVLTGVGLLKA